MEVNKTPRVTNIPGIKKSKKLNSGMPFSIIMPLSTKLVEVPMSVIVPPATAAKDTGSKNKRVFQPFSLARILIPGIKSATIGVLLTIALNKAVNVETDSRKLLLPLPRLFKARSIRTCFLRTFVNAIKAITVSKDGLTAAL